MSEFRGLGKNRRGAAAAEYALILAIIGAAIAIAAIALSDAISNAMDDATTCIESDGVTCN